MSFYKYFPTPSDRMGALWTLDTIEDAYIIEFGPSGTTHFSIEGIVNMNGESECKLFSTHISEHDLTFGKVDRLVASILEVDENFSPKVIFVFSSSLASIIGIDIKSVCLELRDQVQAQLVAVDTGGFKGDFAFGVRNMIKSICKEVVRDTEIASHSKYNIIGGQIDEFNNKSDLKEIKRIMMELFNLDCHCVLSLDSSIEKIQTISEASFNIVIRSEGIDGAEVLKKRFGQNFIKGRPYGIIQLDEFITSIEDLTGLVRNLEKYEVMIESMTRSVKRVETMNKHENYKILVSGNLDATYGVTKFLRECGFIEIKGLVNHKRGKKNFSDENKELVYNPTEFDKKNILEEFKPDIILGDAVLIEFAKENKITTVMQISNPNINTLMLYDGTPFIGSNGVNYLCERLANLIKDLNYN